MRKVTDLQEIRLLLSNHRDYKWVIYQRWNDWEAKEFNLNEEDVKEIAIDLTKGYSFEDFRPSMEIHDDEMMVIQYPRTCRLEGRK